MQLIDANKLYPKLASKDMEELRQIAINDFTAFIRLIAPYQIMGHCHEDLCKWIQEKDREYKLILWPRDHGKSRYAAFYCAWQITRNPAISIIYASATIGLAEKMLSFIKKEIFEGKKYQSYFSNMIHPEEGKRKKWSQKEITVDHPERSRVGTADTTILCSGVGGNIIGRHCDLLVMDDIVVTKNTIQEGEIGREKVNAWVGAVASILSTDNDCLVVGTRYHPKDAYDTLINTTYDIYNEKGDIVETKSMFHVNQADVEVDGQFLWPRFVGKDGKPRGFDWTVWSQKKSMYESTGMLSQFYAQYYNDPNDRATAPISRDVFKYYDKDKSLQYDNGLWLMDKNPLHIFCAVDLAITIGEKSDYTAIAIGGIDDNGNRYLLEAKRYKSDKISETIGMLELLYDKWRFRKLRIEAVGAFQMIAKDVISKLNTLGIRVPSELYNPGGQHKELRIANILEPLYATGSIYHYRGGMTETLENEIVSLHPPHDDLKDAWAMCVDPDFMKPVRQAKVISISNGLKYNSRFGGVE